MSSSALTTPRGGQGRRQLLLATRRAAVQGGPQRSSETGGDGRALANTADQQIPPIDLQAHVAPFTQIATQVSPAGGRIGDGERHQQHFGRVAVA